MTTVSHHRFLFLKSPLIRLSFGLTVVIAGLIFTGCNCVTLNQPLLTDIAGRVKEHKIGPRIVREGQILQIAKVLPLRKVRLVVDDQNGCLKNNQIDTSSIRKKIAHELDVEICDTTDYAPLVTLTVYERSAAPMSFRTFVLTKLTVTSPKSQTVYSDERSDIYAGLNGKPVQAGIDNAIGRLRSTIALFSTSQSPRANMYEAPTRTIDGAQAPQQNGRAPIK